MFQFRRFPLHTYVFSMQSPCFSRWGFPIRIPADLRLFAAPRSFSQLIASFFGFWCQGIHPVLFLAWTSWAIANLFFRSKCFSVFTLSYQYFYCTPLCYVVVIVTLMFPWIFNITRFAFSPFVFYSVFNVQFLTIPRLGGLKWARTTDLALIRRAL